MIIEVKNGDHGLERTATLKEVASFLNEFLEAHPEYSERPVCVAAESGYSGAGIAVPLTAVTRKDIPNSNLHLISDDDGCYSAEYTFYRREEND